MASIKKFFSRNSFATPQSEVVDDTVDVRKRTVLIIDPRNGENWERIFNEGASKDKARIVHCGWDELSLTSYGYGKAIVRIKAAGGSGRSDTSVSLGVNDIVLVRAQVRTIDYDQRHVLYGLKFAGIRSINSWDSIIMSEERPVVQGELMRLQHELGPDAFPVVEQWYYSCGEEMIMTPTTSKMVLKVGPFHAGIGKSLLDDNHAFEEITSIVKSTQHYSTVEEFINYDYDLRVQYVCGRVRVMAKQGSHWKSNTAKGVEVREVEVNDTIMTWVNAAKSLFGGLEIFSLDVLHSPPNGEQPVFGCEIDLTIGDLHILELNGTSSGWWDKYEDECERLVRDEILRRLELE